MKKLYFITNLHSGKATTASKLGMVIDRFTAAGFEVTVRPTQDRMDASAAAEYACGQGFDLIVCSGGDGTLNEVIQGVMKSRNKLPIGYLPSGSTNDFAKSMDIPTNIEASVEAVIQGRPISCDIGSLNSRYFTYIAAFGAFIEVTYETSQNVKNVLGHAAYILSGIAKLKKIRSYHVKVTAADIEIEDNFIFGMVTNSSSVAGILSLGDFLCDDGLYEVTLIKTPANPVELQRIIHGLMNLDEELDSRYIISFKASKITFECEEELNWTADGEFGGKFKKAEIVNNNKAVEIITLPKDAEISEQKDLIVKK